ncbi:MAG: tRNA (N(6)-L-threonylcarbamoyladenosine(37)-C(2))-methylthiotransferase MtaB [Rhodospirillales bacterium]|nr:tRNA (N(6)-L-threonylcarbamoyladenosine(37)-C(2))-methylthiotransferase MtaB [Rhodospirillales bacterium]
MTEAKGIMEKKEPQVVTFGCRLNTYESEVMKKHARNAGLTDAVIFNSCAVTKEAERQLRQAIRKTRRENPETKIIVTGCAAQISPDQYGGMEEIDLVIGNDLKMKAETWGAPPAEKVIVNDIMAVRETAPQLVEGLEGRTRAFVQVQNGCDHRCTFCIIPYGRGNSRSVSIPDIVAEVKRLVENGYAEIVLTGVDIASYGTDLPGEPTLGYMISRVLAFVPDVKRLRLSSMDPAAIDDDIWKLIAEDERFMPHLHLSLQAGDDMILKRMKRRHNRQDVIDLCARARSYRPDMVFGADIIAGFPTETDEMFENTLRIVEEAGIIHPHVFPYSEREGTPAARMPAVDVPVRKERAARLREAGDSELQKFLKTRLNKIEKILVEKDNTGRTEHFVMVTLDRDVPAGSIVTAKVTGQEGDRLTACIEQNAA